MFDFSYSPWLIVALVGLIFFRPDDWHELAFNSGRWARRARAYALEWQEYLEFTTDAADLKKMPPSNGLIDKTNAHPKIDVLLWKSSELGSRTVSIRPYI